MKTKDWESNDGAVRDEPGPAAMLMSSHSGSIFPGVYLFGGKGQGGLGNLDLYQVLSEPVTLNSTGRKSWAQGVS